MRFETRIGIALVVVAAMALVISSAGFTSTQADRQVSVNIVEDDDAYVGLIYDDPLVVDVTDTDLQGLDEPTTVTKRYENASMVTNQYTVGLNVTVEVVGEEGDPPDTEFVYNDAESEGAEPRAADNEAKVPVGASAVFDAEVDCEVEENDGQYVVADQEGTIVVEYHAEGAGIDATVTREVEVKCDGATAEIVTATSSPTPTPTPTSDS
jgi:hypothetical protein